MVRDNRWKVSKLQQYGSSSDLKRWQVWDVKNLVSIMIYTELYIDEFVP